MFPVFTLFRLIIFKIQEIGEKRVNKRFYVYVHKYRHNDIIFYIGKGTNNRLNNIYDRNKVWTDITKNNEWYAEIFQDNLTEIDALECLVTDYYRRNEIELPKTTKGGRSAHANNK